MEGVEGTKGCFRVEYFHQLWMCSAGEVSIYTWSDGRAFRKESSCSGSVHEHKLASKEQVVLDKNRPFHTLHVMQLGQCSLDGDHPFGSLWIGVVVLPNPPGTFMEVDNTSPNS